MTEGPPGEPRIQRSQLGAELRRIRMLAGLSGRELAQAAGLSQSTVSRAERGESVLSLPEVTAWADTTGLPGDRRAVLLALAEAAVNEVATFRVRLASGLAAVVTLETISFGVIPADAEMHTITRCGFILYQDRPGGQPPVAVIETPHASLYASDPADIAVYRDQLARLRQSAVYGTRALDIVRSIAHP